MKGGGKEKLKNLKKISYITQQQNFNDIICTIRVIWREARELCQAAGRAPVAWKASPISFGLGGRVFLLEWRVLIRLAGRGPFSLDSLSSVWDRLIRSTGLSIERDKRWVFGPAAHYSTNHQSATYRREGQNLSWYDPVDDDRELRVMTSIIWLAGTQAQILITCRGKRAYVLYIQFFFSSTWAGFV